MKKLILTLGIIAGLNSLYAAPIHDAARTGDLEKIKSLINSGVDVDSMPENYPYTPTVYSCR